MLWEIGEKCPELNLKSCIDFYVDPPRDPFDTDDSISDLGLEARGSDSRGSQRNWAGFLLDTLKAAVWLLL